MSQLELAAPRAGSARQARAAPEGPDRADRRGQADPPVRGEGLLKAVESLLLRVDRAVASALPERLNPLLQTGAIANTSLIVAIATGVVLLVWYSPSVHFAWSSLEAMREEPLTAQLVRSLHRYSSDACLLFVLLHALQVFAARRFTGARWLAWVTGIALVALLWFTGWLGYWLVWDQRAQQVALGTAKLLDGLPIFADPLSRSFLADESVNSMLFFMVFFIHMLLPLGMGIALWLHLTRLSRPRFLTRTPMTLLVLGTLVAVSLLHPALSAPAARMAIRPQGFTMDFWYLLPLAATDRLGGGALWALVLLGTAGVLAVPWWLGRGRAQPAAVDLAKCNGCTLCSQDCPYDAIRMVPRTDGRGYELQAQVDPTQCVGCGICAGSCDPAGISLPWLPQVDERRRIDEWIEQAVASGEGPHVAFLGADSAGAGLRVDPATGACAELPGYGCLHVPCAGWVHALAVERALRRGARGVLVVGCAPGECTYREGGTWTRLRLAGERRPALRTERLEGERVRFVELDRTRTGELVEQARAFRDSAPAPASVRPPAPVAALAGVVVLAAFALGMLAPSDLAYAGPQAPGPELVVSFKHPGQRGERCRDVSPEEKLQLPPHMRQDRICERGRAKVRLRVSVDGAQVLEKGFEPRGIAGDGNSVAIEAIPLAPGRHDVVVELGDSLDPDEWSHREQRSVELTEPGQRAVVLFDKLVGFRWR